MSQKDLSEKNPEYYPDVFADLINVLLDNGKQLLEANNLQPAPTETLYPGKSGTLRNQFQDVSKYKMKDSVIKTQYTIENETKKTRKMILRKVGYEGALYRNQFEQRNTYPVISIVLYWGKDRWTYPRSIHGFFSKSCIPIEAYPYITNVRLHVFEMAHLPLKYRKLLHSDIKIVADYLSDRKNYKPTNQKIQHLEALLLLFNAITGDSRYEEILPTLLGQEKEEGRITMCELLDKYESKGENRMALLIQKLLRAHRDDDLLKASQDVEFRNQLFQEFGIA